MRYLILLLFVTSCGTDYDIVPEHHTTEIIIYRDKSPISKEECLKIVKKKYRYLCI